jgi:hypothetical protein
VVIGLFTLPLKCKKCLYQHKERLLVSVSLVETH